jgi:hypothetical protein
LTVPKTYLYRSGTGQDEDAYLKSLGYKITTDEDTGEVRRAVVSAAAQGSCSFNGYAAFPLVTLLSFAARESVATRRGEV